MSALTESRRTFTRGDGPKPEYRNLKVAASTVIYAGAYVSFDASGNAVNCATTTAVLFAGVAEHTYDNSAVASATTEKVLRVRVNHLEEGFISGVAATNVRDKVYASTSGDLTLTSTNNAEVGYIHEVFAGEESSTYH